MLNERYSTTRLLTKEKPEIVNNPEDKFETVLFLPVGEDRKGEGGLRTKGYFKKSSDEKPLITVVTVVFNDEKHLEETILSVINQTYDNVEYIIIDGGSTNDTLNIIKKYEHAIDYWVSENDKGLYDAMNKGIDLATGEFIGFVNADDFLYETILSELGSAGRLRQFDFTLGCVDIYTENTEYQETYNYSKELIINKNYIFHMPTHHLSIYIRSNIFKEVGKFNTDFKIRADFDLLIRVIDHTKLFLIFQNCVGGFRVGGVSGSYSTFLENNKILKMYNVSLHRRVRNILPSLLKVFIVRSMPELFVRWLRSKFGSGRYVKGKSC